MQTGLQAAIIAFEGIHKKLLEGIYRKKYLKYCIRERAKRLIEAVKYALNNEMTGLYGYVSYTPQKDRFYIRLLDIRAMFSQLEMTPSTDLICEIINKEITDNKIIDELIKLYDEYKLRSFHYVYLNNLTW